MDNANGDLDHMPHPQLKPDRNPEHDDAIPTSLQAKPIIPNSAA